MKKRLSWVGGFFVFLGVLLFGIILEINNLTVRRFHFIITGGLGMILCLYRVFVPGNESFKLKKDDTEAKEESK